MASCQITKKIIHEILTLYINYGLCCNKFLVLCLALWKQENQIIHSAHD